ncbi:response regulator [Desulforamulus ferrireducens]|uniref:response regulator n=1 Tax=Desulforamulus ferrireducens TaxID=1833852 RepID=UPI001EE3DAA8|nr:response regulator [Desulforamulus ferrireducens]
MRNVVELLTRDEDVIYQRIINYAKAGGFTRYSSTRPEDWRLSVRQLILSLVIFLSESNHGDITVDTDFNNHPVTLSGIKIARQHRARGITLKMFMGMFKYYRRAYLEYIQDSNLAPEEKKAALKAVELFFDLYEIGFCSEWAGEGLESRLTELQETNQLLTNEKNKLRTIFESMTECVFVVNSQMEITEINAAAAAYFGVNPEDVIGMHCSSLMGCKCALEDCQLYQAMKTGGCYKDVEVTINTKRGRRQLLTSGSFLHDISGKYAGGVQVFEDVTERNLMQQTLSLHMQANNSSIECVTIFDESAQLIYANPVARELFQRSEEELMNLGIKEVYHGGEKLLLSLIRGEAWRGELTQIGYILYVHANPIRLPNGKIIGFYVAARDITDHKIVQLKLQQAREENEREAAKLRAIISIMNAAIALVDANDVITEVNEHCAALVGLTRDDIIGKKVWEIHKGEALPKVLSIIEEYRMNPNHPPRTITRRINNMDVILNIQPVYREQTYDGILLMVVDITEVIEAKRQAEQARLAAEKANQAKSEFLANMSHEIRTPMNGILGFAEVLMQQRLNEQQKESVKIIQQCGEQLMELINDILDLSKIESGKLILEETDFSLRKLVHEAVSVVEPKLLEKNVEMKISIESDLPDHFKGDPTRIRQVLSNLLSNAAKFTHQGFVKLSISHVISEDGKFNLKFSVQDTGIGINRDKFKLIFDAFTQADGSTTRKYGGTGLGLTISKSLTQLMGGEMTVESQENKGSTFSFTVPAKQVEEPHVLHQVEKGQNSGVVLVVEDDWSTKQLIVNYLERAGYEVITTQQGKQALTLTKIYHPDVVILDILLPDLNGWEILQRLKMQEESRDIPIIVCSIVPEKERAFSLGAVDFLEKPVAENILLERLGKLINSTAKAKHIVIVDDDNNALQYLKKVVSGAGYVTHEFLQAEEALAYIQSGGQVQAIILDLMMPEMDGFEFLDQVREKPEFKNIPVIINTGKELTPEDYRKLNDKYEKILNKRMVQPEVLLEELASLVRSRVENMELMAKARTKEFSILLVEDNHFNQKLMLQLLSDDYNVTVAENGQQALERLVEGKFDLVLMDMQMPIMDGYEATRRIRQEEKYRDLPIIALTAHAMKGDYEKCINAGCNDYLAKPVKRDTILKKIKQYLKESLSSTKKLRIRDKGIESLVPWYLQDLSEEMEKLKIAAKTNDFTTARYIGHGLKGSGGSYGFPEFSTIGAAIEKAAASEDANLVRKLVAELRELYTKILEEEL